MNLSFESLGLRGSYSSIRKLRIYHTQKNSSSSDSPVGGSRYGRTISNGTGKTAAFSLPMLEQIDIEHKAVQALILTLPVRLAVQVSQAISSFIGNQELKVLPLYGVKRLIVRCSN